MVVHKLVKLAYVFWPRQLFFICPKWHLELAIALFYTTLVLLFLPKLLSCSIDLGERYEAGLRRFPPSAFNAPSNVVLGAVAPVRMLFYTLFVVIAFLVWKVVWNSSQNYDDDTRHSVAFKRHVGRCCLAWYGSGRMGAARYAIPVVAFANHVLADPVAIYLSAVKPYGVGHDISRRVLSAYCRAYCCD
jgi:membrane glycosyltransferase